MPFQIVRNDLSKMKVDAIVGAADPADGSGAGTGAVGTASIRPSHDLPAAYIIRTVGTAWKGGSSGEEEILRSCYRSALELASEHDLTSIAFPLLASDSYGFPEGVALRLLLPEVEAFLEKHDTDVYLVVPEERAFGLSGERYGDIDSYIDAHYVEKERPGADMPVPGFFGAAPGFPTAPVLHAAKARPTAPVPLTEQVKRSGGLLHAWKPVSAARGAQPREEAERYSDAEQCADIEPLEDADPGAGAEPLGSVCASFSMARSLDDCLLDLQKSFMELVFSYADAREMSDVEVQKRANLDKRAFSKLKCGNTRNPSKTTALALAVALRLNLDETKDLLARAGLALSPCSRQDLIVQYFIEHEAYDIHEINIALFEHGETPLGSQAKE